MVQELVKRVRGTTRPRAGELPVEAREHAARLDVGTLADQAVAGDAREETIGPGGRGITASTYT